MELFKPQLPDKFINGIIQSLFQGIAGYYACKIRHDTGKLYIDHFIGSGISKGAIINASQIVKLYRAVGSKIQ